MKDTLACLIRRLKLEGYCTLFLVNNGQWSGVSLSIDRSPWNTDQGSMMGWWSWCDVFLIKQKLKLSFIDLSK